MSALAAPPVQAIPSPSYIDTGDGEPSVGARGDVVADGDRRPGHHGQHVARARA